MTRIDPQTRPAQAANGSRREAHRRDLAEILELDPETMTDSARLVDDLGLDSLAMMTMLTWLETRGVSIGTQKALPATVGELLGRLDQLSFPGLSIKLTDGNSMPARPGDLNVATTRSSLAPVLANHDIRLTPVEPDDVRFLYALSIHPETSFRWRYRGAPPPIDRFAADLWSQVLVQFVARRAADGEPVGHVVAYGADMNQQYAYVGAVFQPMYIGTGLAASAVKMFVRFLFHTFVLRKLYVEVPGWNWPQMRSAEGKLLQVEGVMRDHEHYAGRYWDRYLCAIYPQALADVDAAEV
ncbi:MAG TPA: GNAT family N-acetyltransferase [Micromonosporaceae bacterium]